MDLSYKKFGSDLVFLSNCKDSVVITSDRPTYYPEYKSWNGFNSWVDTVMKNLGLSNKQAKVALLTPQEDIDWILKLPEKILDKILSSVTPFNSYGDLYTPKKVMYWYKALYRIASLPEYLDNYILIDIIKPSTRSEIERIKELFEFMSITGNVLEIKDSYIENLKMLKRCNWLNKPINEVLILLETGVLKPKLVTICNKLSYLTLEDISFLNKYLHRVDPNFIEQDSKFDLKTAIKAGLKPVEILDHKYPKKIANEIISKLNKENHHGIFVCSGIDNLALYEYKCMIGFPKEWFYDCNEKEIVDWAMEHLPQLRKSRKIYGPAGESRTFHYHELLNRITPDMLDKGPKTGWKKIMNLIEQKVIDKIEANLGVYKEFTKFNIPKKKNIIQITNTDDLRNEGELMQHCVGGYVNACLSNKSYIFHVGDKAPGGATVEICKKDGKYYLQQIWGLNDKYPSDAEKDLGEKLVELLNN
jgi:hypothetical protein